jgi:peroxiredoxin Q/BCP
MVAEEGKKAPEFSLPADNGATVSLADYGGKQAVVLYFYPKDQTPGCTTEACDFRDHAGAFAKQGVAVLGVSPDSVKSHVNFVEKQNLNFPLLADVDHAVCEAYGVWKEKNMMGRRYMGVERSTFLIGKDGRIARAWRGVKVPGHVEQVLEAAGSLA